MSDVIRMGGGWGTAAARMSPNMQARCAAADAAYARERVAEQRERAQRQAAGADQRIRASIEMALERGELVDIREAYRNGGVGRTPAEAIAYHSALADIEDAKLARRAQREIDQVGVIQFYADTSADTSAPSESDLAEHQAALQAKQAKYEAAARSWQRRAEARAAAQTEIMRHEERQLLRQWSA